MHNKITICKASCGLTFTFSLSCWSSSADSLLWATALFQSINSNEAFEWVEWLEIWIHACLNSQWFSGNRNVIHTLFILGFCFVCLPNLKETFSFVHLRWIKETHFLLTATTWSTSVPQLWWLPRQPWGKDRGHLSHGPRHPAAWTELWGNLGSNLDWCGVVTSVFVVVVVVTFLR